jgi:hypothetical protein
MDSHITCEVCGEVGNSATTASKPVRKLHSSTTGFINKVIKTGGITKTASKEVVISIRINPP